MKPPPEAPPISPADLAPASEIHVGPMTTRGSVPSTHLGAAAEAATAVLAFIDGLLGGQEVELSPQTTIGRRKDATIVVPEQERAVSALHCTIRRTASGLWVVEDAGSGGGTFLNREKIKVGARPVLSSGDVIGLGQHGPTAVFTLRSSTYVDAKANQLYAITVARTGVEAPDRRRFADRPMIILGRDRDCDLRFDPRGDREVSKRHARIRYGGRCFVLEDTGSSGGTLLNGVRLGGPGVLRPGDVIELGAGGPRLVVEALEGVDEDQQEARDAAMAHADRVAKRGSRWALLAAVGAVVIAGGVSVAVWRSNRDHTEQLAADIERRDVERAAATPATTTKRFQDLAAAHGPAILLVHVRFHLEVEGLHDASTPYYQGDTFGSGFVISAGGLAVTNRHVAQPWLGEPEYADALAQARAAFGADKVKIVSTISAWPSGTELLGADGELAFDRGFNSGKLANLTVLGFPPEHLAKVPFGEGTVELVATDHTDLALLQLTGGSFAAASIPAMASVEHRLQPLDPVMGLGFPAGRQLLEGTAANLSPTLGEVRKVESTVHLSMPTFPGNSGGPVLDVEGRVIGVTTRRFGEGVAVCIPIDKVSALLRHLSITL